MALSRASKGRVLATNPHAPASRQAPTSAASVDPDNISALIPHSVSGRITGSARPTAPRSMSSSASSGAGERLANEAGSSSMARGTQASALTPREESIVAMLDASSGWSSTTTTRALSLMAGLSGDVLDR